MCEKIHQIEIEVLADRETDYYIQMLQTFSRAGKICQVEECRIQGETQFGIPFNILCSKAELKYAAGLHQERLRWPGSWKRKGFARFMNAIRITRF